MKQLFPILALLALISCQLGPIKCELVPIRPTETPTPSPTLEPTPEPTAEPRVDPTATSSPSPQPSPTQTPTGTPIACNIPPQMWGVNGGGGCHSSWREGALTVCTLDYTQWFRCTVTSGAPTCDPDHFAQTGQCCCWRDWDIGPAINQPGGFIFSVTGANIKQVVHSHSVRIIGTPGHTVNTRLCPPVDLKSRDGIPIPKLYGHPFPDGCAIKTFVLP